MAIESAKALKAHLAILANDISASIDFYRKLFGIKPSKVRKGYAKFDLVNPPLNFTLNEVAVAEHRAVGGLMSGGLSHMGNSDDNPRPTCWPCVSGGATRDYPRAMK